MENKCKHLKDLIQQMKYSKDFFDKEERQTEQEIETADENFFKTMFI